MPKLIRMYISTYQLTETYESTLQEVMEWTTWLTMNKMHNYYGCLHIVLTRPSRDSDIELPKNTDYTL